MVRELSLYVIAESLLLMCVWSRNIVSKDR